MGVRQTKVFWFELINIGKNSNGPEVLFASVDNGESTGPVQSDLHVEWVLIRRVSNNPKDTRLLVDTYITKANENNAFDLVSDDPSSWHRIPEYTTSSIVNDKSNKMVVYAYHDALDGKMIVLPKQNLRNDILAETKRIEEIGETMQKLWPQQ